MIKTTPEQNKTLVLQAFDTLFNKRDYKAAERYWSSNYIQHSAHIAPGRDGLFNLVRSTPPTLKYEPGLIVRLWHVYAFALLLGCVTAFDSPARHTFVSELVGEADLSNAVALNSTSFNIARMIGPAIAGFLIATAGSGWVFLISAASFAAVLCALGLLRVGELHPRDRALRARGSLAEGIRYVWNRRDLKAVLVMLFLIG